MSQNLSSAAVVIGALRVNPKKEVVRPSVTSCRVHTGKFMSNSRTFHGLHKDSPSVFKDYNFMKNTNFH